MNEQWEKTTTETAISSGFLGWLLLEQISAVASNETQVMNSNSTSGVQDPLINDNDAL